MAPLLCSQLSTGFHLMQRKNQSLYDTKELLRDLTCPHPPCPLGLIYFTLPLAYLLLSTLVSLVAPQTGQAPFHPRDVWAHSSLCLKPPYPRYPCGIFPSSLVPLFKYYLLSETMTCLFKIFLFLPWFVVSKAIITIWHRCNFTYDLSPNFRI